MRIFCQLRGLLNSTVNEPEFSLKNFWKRGGLSRLIKDSAIIALVVSLKILFGKTEGSQTAVKALGGTTLFMGIIHLLVAISSIGSHIKNDKGGWRWVKSNDYTDALCFGKYYPPIAIIISARFCRHKKGLRMERGLKWHLWYSFLNFLTHSIIAILILFI